MYLPTHFLMCFATTELILRMWKLLAAFDYLCVVKWISLFALNL